MTDHEDDARAALRWLAQHADEALHQEPKCHISVHGVDSAGQRPDPHPMRLAAYTRVSTTEQVKGSSLEDQKDAIRRWAKTNGHKIVAWFTDEGVTGTKGLEGRLGLAEALHTVKTKAAEGMVVRELDRFARDVVVQEQVMAEIWGMGGQVHSTALTEAHYVGAGDDPEDPSRKLVRVILGSVIAYNKDMTVLRMERGRRRKAAAGGFAAFGSPAYGERSVDGVLVADDREAPALARIGELHAEGRSLRSIAATLTEEGHKPKRSDRWHPQTLAKIVARFDTTKTPA